MPDLVWTRVYLDSNVLFSASYSDHNRFLHFWQLPIQSRVNIVEKDKPILAAAMAASVDYLLTGDKNHFSHLCGHVVSDVCVLPSAEFLDLFLDRLFD